MEKFGIFELLDALSALTARQTSSNDAQNRKRTPPAPQNPIRATDRRKPSPPSSPAMKPSAKRRSPAIIRINNTIRDAFGRFCLCVPKSGDFSRSDGVGSFGVRRRKRRFLMLRQSRELGKNERNEDFSCSGEVGSFRMTAKTLILAISAGSALPSFFRPAREKSAAPSRSHLRARIGETAPPARMYRRNSEPFLEYANETAKGQKNSVAEATEFLFFNAWRTAVRDEPF